MVPPGVIPPGVVLPGVVPPKMLPPKVVPPKVIQKQESRGQQDSRVQLRVIGQVQDIVVDIMVHLEGDTEGDPARSTSAALNTSASHHQRTGKHLHSPSAQLETLAVHLA